MQRYDASAVSSNLKTDLQKKRSRRNLTGKSLTATLSGELVAVTGPVIVCAREVRSARRRHARTQKCSPEACWVNMFWTRKLNAAQTVRKLGRAEHWECLGARKSALSVARVAVIASSLSGRPGATHDRWLGTNVPVFSGAEPSAVHHQSVRRISTCSGMMLVRLVLILTDLQKKRCRLNLTGKSLTATLSGELVAVRDH